MAHFEATKKKKKKCLVSGNMELFSWVDIIRVLFTVTSKDRLFHEKRQNRYILFIITYAALLAYFRRLKSVLLRI